MKNLENVLTKYYSIFITSVKSNLAYVKETLYGTTFMLVIMYIFINLWEVAFASKSTSLSMDFVQTVWYLLIAEAIVLSLNPVYITIGEEVQSGSLAYTINRPYNYLAYHFFNGLGESLLRFIINLFSGAILVLILVGPIHVEVLNLVPVGIIIFLAFLLNYCLSALIGFSAFFTEDTSGIAFIYQKFLFILGGVLIPLDFFPGFMKQITNYLPFAFITFAPSKLVIDFSLLNFYHTLSGQVLWIVLFMLILNIVFKIGKRKLTINGG
ncbi:ABC-2 family transporter protein [Bacillus sp. SRB3LM]|uniref:ABC transporter permease n=1 Tax=Bacillus sp. SRB3LM TaxID=2608689 RepID=UPI0018C40F4B|nr:ABC-2 family transporter protein [Bacillus sp. SRB3LM]MBG0969480.1 ABC transporter permease [Bacillus sp. SRB3LM]MBG0971973.1 ABC transporter permease [Bacillus sp. SRB3LM]MBG0971995.1 ABC transporter permease [Bacillus sp. SRB3LM]